jgi:Zn-dependent protease with chaperone function
LSVGLALAAAGIALVAFPAIARRFGRRLDPSEWARLCVLALATGGLVIELALVLYALPTVARAVGVPALAAACERMLGPLVPGGRIVGWAAAAAALTVPTRAAVGLWRARLAREAAWIEPNLGAHAQFGRHDLVTLPVERPAALSIPGRRGQITVTRGLTELLDADELDAVLHHEAAHLELRHDRHLLLATALDHALAFVPLVRASTATLRLALERSADEHAAHASGSRRAAVRRALLNVTRAMVEPGLAAFSGADTVIERLDALESPLVPPSLRVRLAVYAPGLLLGVGVAAALGVWVSEMRMLIAMAGYCVG